MVLLVLHTAAKVTLDVDAKFSQTTDKLVAAVGVAHELIRSKVVLVVAATVVVLLVEVVLIMHSGRSRPNGVLHNFSRSLANFLWKTISQCQS